MAGEAPNTAGFVMVPCATGDAVYKWFEKGKGPSQSTAPAAEAWNNLAKGHVDVSDLINKAVRDSGASWEGAAGDAARGATSPLATWADVTGESATTAGQSTEAIGEAYVNAKNSMSQPPTVPDKPYFNDLAWWETDYDEAVEKNQQANEQNVRAFHQYGQAVQASVNTMPTFISPTAGDAGMEQQGGGDKNINQVDRNGTGDPYTPPNTGLPSGTGQPPGGNDNTNQSGWKPPGSGDTTNPSWQNDPNDPRNRPPGVGDPSDPRNRPPGSDQGIPPGGRWDPNNPNDPRNRGRFDPNDPRNRPGGPGGPGGKGLGGPGGGGGGRGGGGGGLGGAAAARGLGGPGGMGSGFGGAAGVAGEQGRGAGGFGPAGSGAAGAAGRGGAAGMGGGMGGHGGKGEGDEDKEHKSASYLQETEDIFGDGTMVAPPVIGG